MPERAYRGPHLVFPLQKKDIDTLIELFRKKKVAHVETIPYTRILLFKFDSIQSLEHSTHVLFTHIHKI